MSGQLVGDAFDNLWRQFDATDLAGDFGTITED